MMPKASKRRIAPSMDPVDLRVLSFRIGLVLMWHINEIIFLSLWSFFRCFWSGGLGLPNFTSRLFAAFCSTVKPMTVLYSRVARKFRFQLLEVWCSLTVHVMLPQHRPELLYRVVNNLWEKIDLFVNWKIMYLLLQSVPQLNSNITEFLKKCTVQGILPDSSDLQIYLS